MHLGVNKRFVESAQHLLVAFCLCFGQCNSYLNLGFGVEGWAYVRAQASQREGA